MIKEHYKHCINPPTPEETERWQEVKFYLYMRLILEKYEVPQHAVLFAHLFCIDDRYSRKLDTLAQKIIGCDPTVIPSNKEIIILAYKHHVSVMKIRELVHTTQNKIYKYVDSWNNDEWYHPLFDDETHELIKTFNKNVEEFNKLLDLGGNAI